MIRRDFVGEIAVRLGLELVHYDAEHTAAGFPCSARCSFHHSEIAARTNRESCFGKSMSELAGLEIFFRVVLALRAAKNRYDLVFRIFNHVSFLQLKSERLD